jgi:hypothetical protein
MNYSTKQAAAILGVGYFRLYHYIRTKKINLKLFGKRSPIWTNRDIEKMRQHLAELKAKRGVI